MHHASKWLIALIIVIVPSMSGCAGYNGWLAGYGCYRPPRVIDPRGVPVEPCLNCEPVPPTCRDTNACYQCRRTRETFFDSMYAWICECNLCPGSQCCDYSTTPAR